MGNGPQVAKPQTPAPKPNPAVVAGAADAAKAAEAPKKEKTVVTTVTMKDKGPDGKPRIVEFPGKRKIQKEGRELPDGTLVLHIDYINGESRDFKLHPKLLTKFALHGAGQKYTDQAAGETDIEDAITAIDTLDDRLSKGEWAAEKGTGASGSSILLRALVEFTGKTPEAMRAFLETKTPNERLALRNMTSVKDPKVGSLKSIVARLEAEKAAKAKTVDTAALQSELDAA